MWAAKSGCFAQGRPRLRILQIFRRICRNSLDGFSGFIVQSVAVDFVRCVVALSDMMSIALNTQAREVPSNGSGWRSVRRLSAIAVTLLVVFLSSRSSEASSCGSYLYKNGKPVSGHALPMPAALPDNALSPDNTATDLAVIPPDRSVPAAPCRGPNCSRSPFPGLPVPVPVSVSRTSEIAVLSHVDSASTHRSHGVEVPQSESGAFYEPGSVFRPPAMV